MGRSANQNDRDARVALAAKGNRVTVWEMFLAGSTRRQIVEATGLTEPTVREILRELNETMSMQMVELADSLHLRNLARLERLNAAVFPYAIGRKDEEGNEMPPDPSFVKLALDIIKQETSWWEKVQNAKAQMEEEQRRSGEIEIVESTFAASNPLYDIAVAGVNDELDEDEEPEFLLEGLYEEQEEEELKPVDTDRRIENLEKALVKLLPQEEDNEEITEDSN